MKRKASKAKFRVGQVVMTTYSRQPKQIRAKDWHLQGQRGREAYRYSMHDGSVYWETVLRPLTARERGQSKGRREK